MTARTEASIVGSLLIVIATAFPDITSMRQMQEPCLPLLILKLKKKILEKISRSHFSFLVGWIWSHLVFISSPSGGTESVLSGSVRHKSQREKLAATRECKGWSPLGKSVIQTLYQRVWKKKNFFK